MEYTKTNKKGISLIVLVITIIVMIILASAIVITLSNSGIINKANEAVDATNLKQVQELAQVIWAEGSLDNKDAATIKGEIVSKLGDAASKYNIVVTDKGVTVVFAIPGLYKTGTNYTELLKDWDTLVKEGAIHVENGVVYTSLDVENEVNTSSDILVGDLALPTDGSVTAIGDYVEDENGTSGNLAFPACGNLTGIRIPKSVTSICMGAFMESTNLAIITYEGTIEEWENISFGMMWNAASGIGKIICSNDTIIIPGLHETGTEKLLIDWDVLVSEGIIHVENGAVYTNYIEGYLENSSSEILACDLVLPDDGSITTIGQGYMTDGLDGLEAEGNLGFACCINLTGIKIPDSVTSITAGAFFGCQNLTIIKIPNSVTTIDACIFAGCTNLKSVEYPTTVTKYTNDIFEGCEKMDTIKITTVIHVVAMGSG